MAKNHIVLVGAMGSGKSTTGTRLAQALVRLFFDSDAQIEATYGLTGRELAERRGVQWLHDAEAAAFRSAIESDDPAVIAAAASIADRPDLIALLEPDDLLVVLLDGNLDVLAERAATGIHRRPVDSSDMADRIRQRRERFASVADVVISTATANADSVTSEVLAAVAERR